MAHTLRFQQHDAAGATLLQADGTAQAGETAADDDHVGLDLTGRRRKGQRLVRGGLVIGQHGERRAGFRAGRPR